MNHFVDSPNSRGTKLVIISTSMPEQEQCLQVQTDSHTVSFALANGPEASRRMALSSSLPNMNSQNGEHCLMQIALRYRLATTQQLRHQYQKE
jgi:hypothetical protein